MTPLQRDFLLYATHEYEPDTDDVPDNSGVTPTSVGSVRGGSVTTRESLDL